ncbi:ATP-dependent RNA helicase DbpA [Candidatus Entotheonellaceae bacterium PAL068K]
MLIFTEHKDTLDFLIGKLTNLGFTCYTIHGAMPLPKRIDAERAFFEHKPAVLVATEAAGEGINLQFCSLMVNYDMPWNPNRLEQRMGRIHRYGQQQEAMIFNLVADNTREGEVMARLLCKLDAMRKALGSDRVYDVIGEVIPAPRFDELMKDWLSRRRTMTEILAEIDIQMDEEQVSRIRADMQNKALGSRYIDMSKLAAEVQQSKENRLMPEYIERFFREAYGSFGGAMTPVKGKHWSISRIPPDLRKLPESLERKYGSIDTQYPQLTFDKEQVVGYSDLVFIRPGQPLFEGIVERVLREYGPSLRQGACFYNAEATEPTVLWLLRCGVEDGRGRMVGERLFAIHKTGDRYRKSQPYALLDLKTPDSGAPVAAEVRQSATEEDQIIDWSLDAVTPSYFREIEERCKNELSIKEKYVRKSLQFLIAESIQKLTQYDAQLRQIPDGKDPRRLNIQGNRAREEARRNELSQRLKARLAEIEQERHLSEKPPEVVGVAVILPVPQAVARSVEGMESDPEVEKIAVAVGMQYEENQGRKPVSVEEDNCGWDVTSLQEGQVARYIEVKGRAGVGGVALTPNEWIKAQRFGKDYWLYVVVNCKRNPELYLIQDPASKLHPREEVSVMRYLVGQDDWQQAACSSIA